MLPEIGATELMVIAAVALIVVGPKDLPILMRKIGQWLGKMRGLASEFRASFDEMARQSELDELRKEVEALRNTRITDPLTNLHPTFEEVSAGLDPTGFNITGEHLGDSTTPVEQLPQYQPPATEPQAAAPSEPPAAEAAPSAAKPKRARRKAATAEATEADAGGEGVAPAKKPRGRRSPSAEAKA